ncbi:CPXV085 protein [Cowpox virus]|uniref:CPXV085 protein n=1 Tax=Cowpox virus TaxID=10243 RepID=A0A290GQ31_COWPX|nr:CPXV085 protein [Cowpox virus]ATB55563.1 CPXV085 protein [Cowpox virus]
MNNFVKQVASKSLKPTKNCLRWMR